MKSNPRFVWNIGSIAEEYPDMPEQNSEMVLWDRQEKKPVVTIEKWFNSAGAEALESENIPVTKSEYTP